HDPGRGEWSLSRGGILRPGSLRHRYLLVARTVTAPSAQVGLETYDFGVTAALQAARLRIPASLPVFRGSRPCGRTTGTARRDGEPWGTSRGADRRPLATALRHSMQ